jgi:leucyl-tRNA synthetase
MDAAAQLLLEIEARVQAQWHKTNAFQADAAAVAASQSTDDAEAASSVEKYMGTFPFPYMNGSVHLGHAFTLTKVDFQCHFQRLLGKRVIFPFGFHGTGMPISAAAHRLRQEIEQFGNPPTFPAVVEVPRPEAITKTKQSSKVAAKADVGTVYQWDILQKMGVDAADIPRFQDPKHWLHYFPQLARRDLQALGIGVDWRRSFMTTDVNPHFDSFVRWQFDTLRAAGKITFGRRFAIYSPVTRQVTADHDRSIGEGVDVKVSRMIVLQLQAPYPQELVQLIPAGFEGRVMLPAVFDSSSSVDSLAGMEHVWVHPKMTYSLFQGMRNASQLFLCTEASMRNMAFQDFTAVRGDVQKLGDMMGTSLISSRVLPPVCEQVASASSSEPVSIPMWPWMWSDALPGTGIVPAMPADVLIDAAGWNEFVNKPVLQAKFGLSVPNSSVGLARAMVLEYKVASPRDSVNLEKAAAHLQTLQDQPHKTSTISIEHHLTSTGQLYTYGEPASQVVSRAGHDCIVALCEQWLFTYGESVWKEQVREHIEQRLETHNVQTKQSLLQTLDWLQEWGLSRSMGEGTRVPWDAQYVIESLSDSTVYMAFYTVCHLLTQHAVPVEVMTRDIWDYVFDRTSEIDSNNIIITPELKAILVQMRHEFCFWYPVDLRVSGKDLLGNHLVMSLYHHAALWPDRPAYWPQCISANGHILVDGEKMSKAKGNFITLSSAIATYSADATRFALAASGDGLESANFVRGTAMDAILTRLVAELDFARQLDTLPPDSDSSSSSVSEDQAFLDTVFLAQMDACVAQCKAAYQRLQYREVIKYAFQTMVAHRNQYRTMSRAMGQTSTCNRKLLRMFVERVCIMMAPVCPHWAQEIWSTALGHSDTLVHHCARWPLVGDVNVAIEQMDFLLASISLIRKSYEDQWQLHKKRLQKKKQVASAAASLSSSSSSSCKLTVWISEGFLEWHRHVVRILQDTFASSSAPQEFSHVVAQLRKESSATTTKALVEAKLAFARMLFDDALARGPSLALQLPAEDHWRKEEAILRRFQQVIMHSVPQIQDANHLTIQVQRHADDDLRAQAGIKRAYPGQVVCNWLF